MSSGVGAPRRTRARPPSAAPSVWQCRPNWSRRTDTYLLGVMYNQHYLDVLGKSGRVTR
jgi:hypothetical protein